MAAIICNCIGTWLCGQVIPVQLEQKLKLIFLQAKKYERPVDVIAAHDQGFLPYMNKAIKLPDLLRRNRTHLPELLLVLDQTQPLDLLVLSKLRLSAQNGSLALRRITTKNENPSARRDKRRRNDEMRESALLDAVEAQLGHQRA